MRRSFLVILILISASKANCQATDKTDPSLLKASFGSSSKWLLSAGGGISVISKPKGFTNYDYSKLYPAASFMLSVSRTISKKLQVGIEFQSTDLVRKGDAIWYTNPFTPYGTYSDARMHIGKTAFLFTPFLSVTLGRFYLGPQLGYFITCSSTSDNTGKHAHIYYNDFKGYLGGIHGGVMPAMSRHFALFAEAQINYLHAATKKINGISSYGFNCFQGGLSVGMKYAL